MELSARKKKLNLTIVDVISCRFCLVKLVKPLKVHSVSSSPTLVLWLRIVWSLLYDYYVPTFCHNNSQQILRYSVEHKGKGLFFSVITCGLVNTNYYLQLQGRGDIELDYLEINWSEQGDCLTDVIRWLQTYAIVIGSK